MSWHRRRPAPEGVEPASFNMTPMIDIVFQLIIFFMVVCQMSEQQFEELTMPLASEAITQTNEPELIVNVTKQGRIRIDGRTFSDQALEDLFHARKNHPRESKRPVLIRADRSAPFGEIQKIMMIAVRFGEVTRVNFGAKKE